MTALLRRLTNDISTLSCYAAGRHHLLHPQITMNHFSPAFILSLFAFLPPFVITNSNGPHLDSCAPEIIAQSHFDSSGILPRPTHLPTVNESSCFSWVQKYKDKSTRPPHSFFPCVVPSPIPTTIPTYTTSLLSLCWMLAGKYHTQRGGASG
ncbi:hypothetical protein Moror_5932 [Moniliophthora roreri MCA 2997]|uniref:Uncharacterized protein n=1 Tax=Moniliophthora roreri (strain MCA 2997) TaxID=1381753 RepID=V2WYX0_MONRO|nr:hypothetical protein Moror_5932 [Moniliophthora roreri MCA 2997]